MAFFTDEYIRTNQPRWVNILHFFMFSYHILPFTYHVDICQVLPVTYESDSPARAGTFAKVQIYVLLQ